MKTTVTVKELANLAGVSRPTVYKRIEEIERDPNIKTKEYIVKTDRTTLITKKGQAYILNSLGIVLVDKKGQEDTKKETENANTENANNEPEDSGDYKEPIKGNYEANRAEIEALNRTIEILEAQLKEKDRQISKLIDTIHTEEKAKAISTSAQDIKELKEIKEAESGDKSHLGFLERIRKYFKS